MAGNSFGQLFKITTFGESHGPAIGVVKRPNCFEVGKVGLLYGR